jgi:exopolysaccharide biosynthesis polyprenyl glycosylphosphotransferase
MMNDSSVRRNWRQVHLLMAVAADSISVWAAAFTAFWLRRRFGPAVTLTPDAFLNAVVMFWLLFIAFASIHGLYRAAYHVTTRVQIAIGIRAYFFTIPATLSLLYLFHLDTFPRGFVVILFVLVPCAFVLVRGALAGINAYLQRFGFGTFNAVVLGLNGAGNDVIGAYQRLPQLGCRVKGIIDPDILQDTIDGLPYGIPHYPLNRLAEIVSREQIERVLVPSIEDAVAYPELLDRCRALNIDLKVLSPEFEGIWNYPFVHDVAGIPLYVRRRRKTELLKKLTKRVFDIVGAGITLIVTAPIFLLAAAAIALEDGLPVFFRQRRALALGQQEVEVVKLRSMIKNSEKFHDELLKENKTSGGLLFVDNDPRITRVGKVLRRFSFDELPQLFTVLTGEMSLVGPRPLVIKDLENISPENTLGGFYTLRSKVKPGMTGLWQISGRREVSFKDMVLLDLYYIENQSIMFDIEILFATINVVLFGKGAH